MPSVRYTHLAAECEPDRYGYGCVSPHASASQTAAIQAMTLKPASHIYFAFTSQAHGNV